LGLLTTSAALACVRYLFYISTMPSSGVRTLSDIREPTVTIGCEPCGRRGRYGVAKLIDRHGADIKMPDLLALLANCPKARSASIHDGCKAVYERLLP
jgi:hypothetical protein